MGEPWEVDLHIEMDEDEETQAAAAIFTFRLHGTVVHKLTYSALGYIQAEQWRALSGSGDVRLNMFGGDPEHLIVAAGEDVTFVGTAYDGGDCGHICQEFPVPRAALRGAFRRLAEVSAALAAALHAQK